MLLTKDGVTQIVTHPADIARLKRAGWVVPEDVSASEVTQALAEDTFLKANPGGELPEETGEGKQSEKVSELTEKQLTDLNKMADGMKVDIMQLDFEGKTFKEAQQMIKDAAAAAKKE